MQSFRGRRYYSLFSRRRTNGAGDNLKPQKSLGQHWLRSEKALKTIIRAGELTAEDTVLEIGPGKGVLTAALLQNAGRVIAVEKDERLIAWLREKFSADTASGKLKLICGDILKFEARTLKAISYKLIANLPYYLTGKILRQFLTAENQPRLMVLMLQKEVADRIVTKNKKESLLSISVKAFGNPEYVEKVPAGAFSPTPKVDSAILRITNISRQRLAGVDEGRFFALLKKGFGQKRKQLKNNLGTHSRLLLQKCKIKETARAEDLRFADWLCLTKKLSAAST